MLLLLLTLCLVFSATGCVENNPDSAQNEKQEVISEPPIQNESFYMHDLQNFPATRQNEGGSGPCRIQRCYVENYSFAGSVSNTRDLNYALLALELRTKEGTITKLLKISYYGLKNIELEKQKVIEFTILEDKQNYKEDIVISARIIDFKDGKPSYRPYS